MALGVTVTNNNSATSPGLTIAITGLVAGTYTVFRQDQVNAVPDVPVRGADTITVVSSFITITDREAPLGSNYTYRVINAAQTPVVSSVIPLNIFNDGANQLGQSSWIKNTSDNSMDQNIIMESWEGNDYEAAVLSTNRVLGRKNPAVFTDVWGARTGSFTVFADSDLFPGTADVHELFPLLTSGDVLLLQHRYDVGGGGVWRDIYFVVTSLSEAWHDRPRFSTNTLFNSGQSWNVGYTEVDRPPTLGVTQGIGTWGDLKLDASTNSLTYAAIATRDTTYANTLFKYST